MHNHEGSTTPVAVRIAMVDLGFCSTALGGSPQNTTSHPKLVLGETSGDMRFEKAYHWYQLRHPEARSIMFACCGKKTSLQ